MKYKTNQERTAEYLSKFDRQKVLRHIFGEIETPTIFDVGANNGSSIEEFINWWPNATIHAFEPQVECADSLFKIASNISSSTGKIYINSCAVGATTEDRPFYTHEISSGLAGFNKINLSSLDSIYLNTELKKDQVRIQEYERIINHGRLVKTVSLNDYCQDRNIQSIDLLKIDTQGHEPEVLSGLGARLSAVKVVVTELMFYDYYERSLSFSDLEKYLIPSGFTLYDISHIAKNPMNGRTDWVDIIYVNKGAL